LGEAHLLSATKSRLTQSVPACVTVQGSPHNLVQLSLPHFFTPHTYKESKLQYSIQPQFNPSILPAYALFLHRNSLSWVHRLRIWDLDVAKRKTVGREALRLDFWREQVGCERKLLLQPAHALEGRIGDAKTTRPQVDCTANLQLLEVVEKVEVRGPG
jgi:hypothetical protein